MTLDFDPPFSKSARQRTRCSAISRRRRRTRRKRLQKAKKLGWDLTDPQARLASYAASKPWTGNFFEY